MNTLLKGGCAAVYLLALVSLAWTFPMGAGPILQKLALILLLVHAVEAIFVFKYIKTYSGPLLTSIVLSLLFGLLHWMPLAKAHRQNAQA